MASPDLDHSQTTIVVPAWDTYVTAQLDKAIASLTSQRPQPRVLIVDNASNVSINAFDGVEQLRSERRLTLGAVRNFGLAHVDTPYVMFWDADDLMLSGTVGLLETMLASDPGLIAAGAAIFESVGDDIVSTPPSEMAGADAYVRHRWPREWIGRLVAAPRLLALTNCVWSVFPTTGATLLRVEAVRACGGFGDADSGEDWTLGAALAFHGRFGWSERPGRLYARHLDSVWGRHHSADHQSDHAAAVRERLAADPVVPQAVKRLLPVISLAQGSATALQSSAGRLRNLLSR